MWHEALRLPESDGKGVAEMQQQRSGSDTLAQSASGISPTPYLRTSVPPYLRTLHHTYVLVDLRLAIRMELRV